uniref:Uncharacterized protein n=1 Tax=Caenorhabditis japonica TaxID=281687 RepID=A0A8R1I898_CAEJA
MAQFTSKFQRFGMWGIYCCKWPERTMGVIGLTAVEVLAFCLGFGLLLAVLIVICNCVSTCWEMLSHRRKKQRVERLPDNYVDEIHRLLHRNQKACEYDCVVIESRRQSANLEYIADARVSESSPPTPPPSEQVTPRRKSVEKKLPMLPPSVKNVRMESEENMNTNTTNSQSTITASESGEVIGALPMDGKSKRRTWGRLSSSLFDAVMMPSVDTTTTEDTVETTSSSNDNLRYGLKIETTV